MILLASSIFLSFFLSSNPLILPTNSNSRSIESKEGYLPFSATSYENNFTIIDAEATINNTQSGNWTWASTQPWCSGVGSFGDPYIIQDIEFNISSGENGLTIRNSKNVFFIVSECNFTNADGSNSGVRLENTSNGTITNNKFHNNGFGINLFNNCDNNTISFNYVNESSYSGIQISSGCDENRILNNFIANSRGTYDGSHGVGIFVRYSSMNNTISNNSCSDSQRYGMRISNGSNYSKIMNNTIINSPSSGIYLYQSSNNTLGENNITNSAEGILLENSSSNTLDSFEINDCSSNGISAEVDSSGNIFTHFNITDVRVGIYLRQSSNNYFEDVYMEVQSTGLSLVWGSTFNEFSNIAISGITQYGASVSEDSPNNEFANISLEGGGFSISGALNTTISGNCTLNGKEIITLRDISDVILDGKDDLTVGQIILANCENVTIKNYNLSDSTIGITFIGCNNIGVSNNTLGENSYVAILGFTSTNSIISDNNLSENQNGIEINKCDNTYLLRNSLSYSTTGNNGFVVHNSNNLLFLDNTCENYSDCVRLSTSYNISGKYNHFTESSFYIDEDTTLVAFGPSNLLDGLPLYYFCGYSKLRIGDTTSGNIYLKYCSQILLENIIISELYDTIRIYNSNDIIVRNITVEKNGGNSELFYIGDCFNVLIQGGIFNDTKDGGLGLSGVTNITVEHCLFSNGTEYALNLYNLVNFTIRENWFYNMSNSPTMVYYECESGNIDYNVYGNVIDPWASDDGDNQWVDISNNIEVAVYNSSQFSPLILDTYTFYLPIIINFDDISITGHFNRTISWDLQDTDPDSYFITCDGELVVLPTTWNNGTASYVIPAGTLQDGLHTYKIWVNDTFDNKASAEITVDVEGTLPTISSTSTYSITGLNDLTLNWMLNDSHPLYYVITQNQTLKTSLAVWENGSYSYIIPALSLVDGIYSYQIWVNDTYGNGQVFETIIIVDGTAPVISSSQDEILISDGSSIRLNWTLSDWHPGEYSISVNGTTMVASTVWSNGLVSYNFTFGDLPAGNYTIQITVQDSFGNEIVNSIIVSVPESDDSNGSFNPWVLVFVGAGIGGGVVALIVVVKRAKEESD